MAAYDHDNDERPLSEWKAMVERDERSLDRRYFPQPPRRTAAHDSRPLRSRDGYVTTDHTLKKPLIDQVTNRWQHEKGFDSGTADEPGICDLEDERSYPDIFRDLFKSRRFRRMLVVIVLVLTVCYYGWKWYVQPGLQEERAFKQGFLHARLNGTYGIARAGEFEGVRIKELEGSLLPGGHSDPEGRRRLVFIGDIHGCKEDLVALLDKIGFDAANDHLVATGDVTSKGPDSLGVLDELIRLGAESVRGNHEDRSLESAKTVLQTTSSPAKQSFTSKGQAKDAALLKQMKPHHLRYLRNMPLMLHIPALPQSLSASKKKKTKGEMTMQHEIVVVHAGLVPNVPLDHQDPFFVMNMRSIDHRTHIPSSLRADSAKRPWYELWNWYNDRLDRGRSLRGFVTLPPPTLQHPGPAGETWLEMLFGRRKNDRPDPYIVVYGHDSKSGLQIHPWSKGLDSACVAGGKLTAMVLSADGKTELVSTKCRDYKV